MSHKFQVHLSGLINLLSNHLYSGPEVFVRELLQNGVDAIRARQFKEPQFTGKMSLELSTPVKGVPTITFMDNGVGLTEDEVHRFLAIIGESSKRAETGERPTDFIGQFGIGLLSCFLVSDEIVVVSRSITGTPAVEWRGKPDGTYQLKTLDADLAAGTQVFLRCKSECEEFFDAERLTELAKHYGGLLPFPITVVSKKGSDTVNTDELPWKEKASQPRTRQKNWMKFGEELFGMKFLDAVPLISQAGEAEGLAFVLPHSPSLSAKRSDRVYLKRMLLSESADKLLPDWAFFVKAVVNANDLRPTASRESFYEDQKLEQTREELGECLRRYLVDLSRNQPEKFRKLLGVHQLAIEALAVADDDCFRLFIEWLPFETAEGRMTLPEYLERHDVVRYIPDLDQFRQIARIAAAQDIGVINGGYVYSTELLEKFAELNADVQVTLVESSELVHALEDLTEGEQDVADDFLQTAEAALRSYRCAVDLRKFQPSELTSLFSINSEGRFLRSLEQSQESADSMWSGVLNNLVGAQSAASSRATLCFNQANPLIQKLVALGKQPTVHPAVQMLYVQALLMAHQPLSSKEWKLFNEGLLTFVESGLTS
ncbi:MAG: HSP90 family protein [Planctomycetota bacterium]|nr:HSP90 family protein [Planctomycetota bacterium]